MSAAYGNWDSPRIPSGYPRYDHQDIGYNPALLAKFSKQELVRRDLDEQVRLKADRKKMEMLKLQEVSAKEAFEMRNYNPYGRGGAGAPIRNCNGVVLADLRHTEENDVYATSPTMYPPEQNTSPFYPQLGLSKIDFKEEPNQVVGSARFSRFQFDKADPEQRDQLSDKHRKHVEADRLLRDQVEQKRRQKENERARREEEDRLDEERIARERVELRLAFEREKGGRSKNTESKTTLVKVEDSYLPNRDTKKNDIFDRDEPPMRARRPPINYISDTKESRYNLTENTLNVIQDGNEISMKQLSVLREELLGENDALRREIRKQEEIIREIHGDIQMVKRENEKLRRRHNAKEAAATQQITNQIEKTGLKSQSLFVQSSTYSSNDSLDVMLGIPSISNSGINHFHRSQPVQSSHQISFSDQKMPSENTITSNIAESTVELDMLLQNFLNE